jgi:hypothetical protein
VTDVVRPGNINAPAAISESARGRLIGRLNRRVKIWLLKLLLGMLAPLIYLIVGIGDAAIYGCLFRDQSF